MTIDNKLKELAKAIRNKATYTPETTEEGIARYAKRYTEAQANQIIAAKRTLAIAEQHKITTSLEGYIKAVASNVNPLQTELELFITNFNANKNKQGVRRNEAQNILRTAINSPLKINFDTFSHSGAKAIGSITNVEDKEDRIIGRAVIWNDMYPDEAAYIQNTKELGVSWEIYYDTDLSVKDSTGVLWLSGCVFAGTCIVDNPAYGPDAKARVIG